MDGLSPHLEQLDTALLGLPIDSEAMLLSELDGFLAGVIVSPEFIPPGEWLKLVWGGGDEDSAPVFDNIAEVQTLVGLIMQHYNDVLQTLETPGHYVAIFDVDTRFDETIWELWIDGFARAMEMRPQGWIGIAESDDQEALLALTGIALLSDINTHDSDMTDEQIGAFDRDVPDLIPQWVEILHQWRCENEDHRPLSNGRTKIGRNDPCLCGSGKKYKKCCGLN
jgi:uncharacterized protein